MFPFTLIRNSVKALLPAFFVSRLRLWSRTRAYVRSYLQTMGWRRSVLDDSIIDNHGPVPWITFPARRMLGAR